MGHISGNLNLFGFKLEENGFKQNFKECSQLNDFLTIVQLILIARDDLNFHFQILNKCKTSLSRKKLFILNLVNHEDLNTVILKKNMKIYKFTKSETDQIEKILKIKSEYKTKIEGLDLIENKKILSGRGNDVLKELNVENEFLQRIKENGDGPLTILFEAALALRVGNRGWAERRLNSFLTSDQNDIIFDSNFTQKVVTENLFQKILQIMKFLNEELNDELLFKMLVSKVIKLSPINFRELISKEFSADWSLNEIRERIKFNKGGHKYTHFWYGQFANRVSSREVNTFLARELNYQYIDTKFDKAYWFLGMYFPADKEIRRTIVKQMENLHLSKDKKSQFKFLYLLDNEVIRQHYIKSSKKTIKPLFQMKRDFYKKLLDNGEAHEYAIYNLIKLGDYSDHLLWWLVL